jgi:hypothetical protein
MSKREPRKADLGRMFDWLAWAAACYLFVILLRYVDAAPQLQTVLWKLGNLNVAAYAGYWIDRRAFRKRIDAESSPHEHIRRAIVMAAAMVAVALGL